ncbi:MAG: DUF3667 domain-containing protein [Chitinophagaceae bacterium]|nr:DUF3667 domain-containing protein [Chitinophagaceae bacterium]
MATHFIYDITHFDGKFFSTLKYLLFKPAFLSKEYLKGRRTSYLHPIRMYVFTSAIFFLIFFNFYQSEESLKENEERKPVAEVIKQLKDKKDVLEKTVSNLDTTDVEMPIKKAKFNIEKLNKEIAALQKDSTKRDSVLSVNNNFTILGKSDDDYPIATSIRQYDSIQNALPIAKRDGFIWRRIYHQRIHLNEKYKYDGIEILKGIGARFMHMFPQMLFVSLPFFALILQLLYVRRKQLYYVNHVVFTIHLYCGTFILILASLLIGSILQAFHIDMAIYGIVAYLIILFYWYKSFRNFYSQSRGKTALKFVLLFFMTMLLMSLLFVLFFTFSVFLI